MGESDVEPHELAEFFGAGDELQLLFNFLLNNYIYLALARESAEPLIQGLNLLPQIPRAGQWANFLRNLDELDLERLSKAQREEVFAAFAPKQDMRIFGRGIRRRLAPMLGGDRRRIELALSLLFSLPGTPLLVYGDEIGMGEDLSLPGRQAVRTPMQWSGDRNGGFSKAPEDALAGPMISKGDFGYEQVNVAAQRRDPKSLLHWTEKLVQVRKSCPEWGWGTCQVIETGNSRVFAHRCEWEGGVVLALHNLADQSTSVTVDLGEDGASRMLDIHEGRANECLEGGHQRMRLRGYEYCWFRLSGDLT